MVTSNTNASSSSDTAGVQQLIDRLKSEGVQEGKQQADALLLAAKKEAAAILDAARVEADAILRDAGREAERTEANGTRALTLAARDTSLQLKEQLEREFRGWIGGMVQQQLDAPDFLAKIIREMAGQCNDAIGEATDSINLLIAETGSQNNKAAHEFEKFVASQAAAMFEQGVSVQLDPSVQHGFRMRLEGNNVEIDMTDEGVSAALMRFLAPKFRKLIGSSLREGTNE
jgi:V/A-type H+-transporting ATPase subunit E